VSLCVFSCAASPKLLATSIRLNINIATTIPAINTTKSNKTNKKQFDKRYKAVTSGSTERNKSSTNTTSEKLGLLPRVH
jgi:hypothetical protein